MANVNAPFGLRWLGLNNSPATPSDSILSRNIVAGSVQAAYNGDIMLNGTDGNVIAAIAAPALTAAGLSSIAGIFQGCSYLSNASGKREFSKTWPGGALVANGPILAQLVPLGGVTPGLFVVQSSGAAPVAYADIGANIGIAYAVGTVLSSGYSKSGVTVAQGSIAAATVFSPFRIRGLWSQYVPAGQPGTDDTTPFNWVVVSFNSLQETGA